MTKQDRSYRRLGETTKFGRESIKPLRRGDTRPQPMFLLIKGPQKGRPLPLPEGHWTLGRGAESDFSVHGRGISRIHLQLESRPDKTVIARDAMSTNGMQVNGKQVRDHEFKPGDILQIGPEVALKFALLPACELDLQVRLYSQSIFDDLTGLYNRRYFIAALRQALASALRHHKPLCLLLVDIDRFKQVNDTHGHTAGDNILTQFADLLAGTLREEDLCARIGGEEFAVMLGDMEQGGCLETAERIRTLIAGHPFTYGELQITCTASFGGAMAPKNKKLTPGQLLKLADANLYQAKHRGRNCTVIE